MRHVESVKQHDKLLEREVQFHDDRSHDIDLDKLCPKLLFEGSTCPENRFIMKHIGDLQNKRVLELGCGAGEASVYLATKGAKCLASDCSPGMLHIAKKLAKTHNVEIETQALDSMDINADDNSFDIVYAANILHHTDHIRTLQEIHRVLKPGGKGCFWDPLKHNPIINIYRRMATEVRSDDEHPLNINVVHDINKIFSTEVHDTFWYSTLWLFLRFYLIEHVHPNEEAYWKKIIYEENRLRPMYKRLARFDELIKRIPFLRRYAWNIAIVATK